jgi:peptidoglycan hydrolase-like protein with peptidoglycan-binding domain
MRPGVSRLTGNESAAYSSRCLEFVLHILRSRPRDSIAAVTAGLAAVTILINALFMQKGPHPAPIFAVGPVAVAANPDPIAALLARQGTGGAEPDAARPTSNMVADIQRELARRGFYNGAIDGVYGPQTDAAIRDFEEAAQLRPSAEPNDALLGSIRRSSVQAKPAPVKRDDQIAALLGSDKRLIALQRALADFGYGPLMASGVHDAATKAAIERYERARRQPATGQVTERLVRDLAALTGRPLE